MADASEELQTDGGMPNIKKLNLSSQKRASSAPSKERPPPPLTPRNKKASRSLFKELEGTCRTMRHTRERVLQVLKVVQGTIGEIVASYNSATDTLSKNASMAAGTKETQSGTGGSKGPQSPGSKKQRPMTADEKIDLKRELRDKLEAEGQERDPTDDEVKAEADKRMAGKKFELERAKSRAGVSNKPIVVALEALRDAAQKQSTALVAHERVLQKQLADVQEIEETLESHRDMRDSLFDPVKSTDLRFARKMGVKPIERSVLYQKMNFVPKDKHGKDLKCDWNDKDQEAAEGKRGAILDAKGNVGLTGHEATFCAADREDQSRAVCNKAMKAVRDARSELALRKSTLQVAVRMSREIAVKQKRAAKTGNFGTSEQRNTDPASRKLATTPED